MSLLCSETRRHIEYGDVLMAGTKYGATFYAALSQEALSQIPESEKHPHPSSAGGINIHHATSTENFNGNYNWCDFALGEFAFSISWETAERYLPGHIKEYSH